MVGMLANVLRVVGIFFTLPLCSFQRSYGRGLRRCYPLASRVRVMRQRHNFTLW